MKLVKELEIKFSLSFHQVVEVQKDNVDIVRGSPKFRMLGNYNLGQ